MATLVTRGIIRLSVLRVAGPISAAYRLEHTLKRNVAAACLDTIAISDVSNEKYNLKKDW